MGVRISPSMPKYKGKFFVDSKSKSIVSTSFIVSVLLYSFEAVSWKDLPEDQRVEMVKKWADKASENLVKALKAAGYEILPVSAISTVQ